MPHSKRLHRRLIDSQLPTRLIAHLSVVTLVVAASLVGMSQMNGTGTVDAGEQSAFSIVSQARGAADPTPSLEVSSLVANPLVEEGALVDRGTRAVVPDLTGPMPTPVPVDPNATPLAAPTTGGATGFADASSTRGGPPRATGALLWPVPAGSISQYYHAGHLALDIAAPYGSQIIASQAGTVTWAGWRNNGGGYVISVDHGNGMTTVYNHLGSIWVSPGQYVGAGQGIGGVGCTGLCTGPHVHFEVIVNGMIDNPLRYL